MPVTSIDGKKHRIDIVDHGTSWVWAMPVKEKSDIEELLRRVLVETKGRIKEVRVDGAKEFIGVKKRRLAKEFSFNLKISQRYAHEQAGKVEGDIRLLTV